MLNNYRLRADFQTVKPRDADESAGLALVPDIPASDRGAMEVETVTTEEL